MVFLKLVLLEDLAGAVLVATEGALVEDNLSLRVLLWLLLPLRGVDRLVALRGSWMLAAVAPLVSRGRRDLHFC